MMLRAPSYRVRLNPVSTDLFASAAGGVAFLRNAGGTVTGLAVGTDRMWRLEMRRLD